MSAHQKTVALVGRYTDPRVAESLGVAVEHLRSRGVGALLAADQPVPPGVTGFDTVPEAAFAERADLVLAIGGDGTLLYAARLVAAHGVPLLGINRGRLGFLTDVLPREIQGSIDAALDGHCDIDERPLLEAQLTHAESGLVERELALNDVVLQKIETGRMLDFETWLAGRYVNTHGGDGLVVASATGSTAYALSCGGPIVEPHLDVMVVVPICPHTLSDRPFVVSRRTTVEVRLVDRDDSLAQATVDGTVLGRMVPGDRLCIGPASHSIRLLHPQGYDYFRLLRSKLHWGRADHDHIR